MPSASKIHIPRDAEVTSNFVNLDALIRRADLAARGEEGEDITSLSLTGLTKKGFLYPALRKPDFQRETASWSPEQVADLVITFANQDLIPAIILWRAGTTVFVIDGAHRLSALIAWVQDDYGDGEVSRKFFQNSIPDEQLAAADRARNLVHSKIGAFGDHQLAIEYPERVSKEIAERASRIGWHNIPAQWIRNADHEKAENSFFRINQGGTKINPVESRILKSRGSATALAARAILRSGTGHSYWEKFNLDTQEKIEELGADVHRLLFEPSLTLPIKTLDVPLAGQGYGSEVLPFLFDLVNLINDVEASDSTNKKVAKDDALIRDPDGRRTVKYLTCIRSTLWRLCSNHASSLGLHPALYFYSHTGVFQPSALFSMISTFKGYENKDYVEFVRIREKFELILLANRRSITEAVRKLGSGMRSRPRVVQLYKTIIRELQRGALPDELYERLSKTSEFSFLLSQESDQKALTPDAPGKSFKRETKGAVFLRDAIPTAAKCPTCQGLLHRNGMQTGHRKAKRGGGSGEIENGMTQHPFCNSTVAH